MSQSRSNDISIIKDSILTYIPLVETIVPEGYLKPIIISSSNKNEDRGFNHPMLTRFLCPARLYLQLMADPQQ